MHTITLYTRPGCHLCAEARALLTQAGRGTVRVEEHNVDEDADLHDRYSERIPVAVIGGQELAWPFTIQQARAAIDAAGYQHGRRR